jgi:hypothetical protein
MKYAVYYEVYVILYIIVNVYVILYVPHAQKQDHFIGQLLAISNSESPAY